MDVTAIIEPLNDAQREAVTAPSRPTLVLAGAGSGKTRVLVHRIAWLIQVEGLSPQRLLAVTFTNKAAAEMRHRIEALLGFPTQHFWIGTFHGLAHRLLRIHCEEAGLPEGFQIMDSEDQLRLIRRLLKSLEIDESEVAPKEVQWFINAQKDEGRRPANVDDEGNAGRRQLIDLYARYEKICADSGLVDFGELLLRATELLVRNEDIRAQYQQRFQHILVDEFQDTNAIQYEWLKLLAGSASVPFVVGDDDQSIYRWRGARVENLHRFQKDFPGAVVVRLEQNYRSTETILTAANAVIANNSERLGKNLWTAGDKGELIKLYAAFNERDEAEFVVNRIVDSVEGGMRRSELAVLYRSNAQSRTFEEALLIAGIPYRVYGGMRFFERAEIKDALAYLRLIANRDDDPSFERIVNVPTRGIGARTVEAVREQARQAGTSLWRAAAAVITEGRLAK
ncbi:MAG: UvrD-helicase domain-containing protein, partial [Gammaproteobacteria bacterium]|nr:UvrD-helicase domain-containing protein [Gammaproteobacteria bacterium]